MRGILLIEHSWFLSERLPFLLLVRVFMCVVSVAILLFTSLAIVTFTYYDFL
jgi:hypothetical protein